MKDLKHIELTMKIEGKEVTKLNYLGLVTYVPAHAEGNAGHPDCEQGVIIDYNDLGVKVLYSKGRQVQQTQYDDLVWG